MSRGFHIAPRAPWKDLEPLLTLRPPLIRYQMHIGGEDLQAFMRGVEEEGRYVQWLLDYVSESSPGTKVVLDMHRAPGGMTGTRTNLFNVGHWGMSALRSAWSWFAMQFKGHPALGAYGILNEPGGTAKEVENLMSGMVQLLRSLDAKTPIAVTCPYGDPARFQWKEPIAKHVGPVWYEVHVYWPISFTHQGIYDYPYGRRYPTAARWNKEALQKHLSAVREFQRRTKATIYVGEFGCTWDAQDADYLQWFKDCISTFERWRWAWTVHAWREAPVWEVESAPAVMSEITRRWR